MTIQEEVDKLSTDELKRQLITSDYRGIEFKKLCLERLLHEAKKEVKIHVVKILDEKTT